jgi:hypothetical protein
LKVWERNAKIAGKVYAATRCVYCAKQCSFDVASLQSHHDESQNHTLTNKYKTKSFLQMIGRIPVPQAPIDNAMKAVVKVEKGRVKVENEGEIISKTMERATRMKIERGLGGSRQSIRSWMESATRRLRKRSCR